MGGRAGGGAGGGMGRGSASSGRAKKAMTAFEESVRNLSYENIAIFDENGNIVFQAKGDADSVAGGITKGKDNISIHNHPGEGYGSTISFSKEDIINAVRGDEKETRVVTKNYTYSLKRPAKGWGVNNKYYGYTVGSGGKMVDNADIKRLKQTYASIHKKVKSDLSKYINKYKGSNSTATDRANAVIAHKVNKEFAKAMGWTYTKTKVK